MLPTKTTYSVVLGFRQVRRAQALWFTLPLLVLLVSSVFITSAFAGKEPVENQQTLKDFMHLVLSPHTHIESVQLTLNTLNNLQANKIEKTLRLINGVESVRAVRESNLIEVSPQEEAFLDLYDIRTAVNALREVKVIRMDVVASGKLSTFLVRHFEIGSDPHPHERHRLTVGNASDEVFVLAQSPKLEELLGSGTTHIVAIGTVPAFEGHSPILHLTDFMEQETNLIGSGSDPHQDPNCCLDGQEHASVETYSADVCVEKQ